MISILLLVSRLAGAADTTRVNVLLIAVDDLKPTIGCFGDSMAITPNMDAIAEKGTVFLNNYCQQAVCAPSRASLLTGRYPDQMRIWDLQTQLRELNPGITTLPQYLRKFGYETAATGKVFDPRSVDDARDAPSWSVPYRGPWDIRYYDKNTGKPAAYFYASAEAKDTISILSAEAEALGIDEMEYIRERYFPPFENADVPVDAYSDGAIANAGMELLEELAAGEKPFFLAVGFNRPHLPFNAPSRFWELYDRSGFTPAPFRQKAAGSPDIGYHKYEELRSYTGIPESGSIPEATQLELIHGYYAAVSYIDFLIGLLIDRLDELGLSERTAIVLWGDHGWHLGDHNLWCKHSNFEQATRSPLIISVPGQPNAGSQTASPTEFTDISPTICEMAALPVPEYFEAESLLPLMEDTAAIIREGSLSQYPRGSRMGYSLRTVRYRYTKWVNANGSLYEDELYDYQADPLETVDFSEDPDYLKVIAHLDSLLTRRITHPSTQNRILIHVSGLSGDGDTIGIANATIRFEDSSLRTGSQGTVQITHPDGTYPVRVDAEDYDAYSETIHIGGDTTISIFLGTPDMDVSIRALNYYTGEGIRGATVVLNGSERKTDFEGRVILTEKQGSYQLHVEHDMYGEWSGTLYIGGDTAFTLRMKPTRSTIRIVLKEGSTPVAGTTVAVDGVSRLTSSWGTATFDSLATEKIHPWRVDKEGYLPDSGSIYLVADTTVVLQMERIVSLMNQTGQTDILIWPNPVEKEIHLVVSGQDSFLFRLCTPEGRVLVTRKLSGSHHRINLETLPEGTYMVVIDTPEERVIRKIIKIP